MNDIHTVSHARRSGSMLGRRRYWSGFSVCLFIVLLSVFTWVIHRRLTQYQTIQQAGAHHMTATKVCLTERPQISVPSTNVMNDLAMFFVVIAFAGALFQVDDSLEFTLRRDQPPQHRRTRIKPCLAHFFFLPPPTSFLAL